MPLYSEIFNEETQERAMNIGSAVQSPVNLPAKIHDGEFELDFLDATTTLFLGHEWYAMEDTDQAGTSWAVNGKAGYEYLMSLKPTERRAYIYYRKARSCASSYARALLQAKKKYLLEKATALSQFETMNKLLEEGKWLVGWSQAAKVLFKFGLAVGWGFAVAQTLSGVVPTSFAEHTGTFWPGIAAGGAVFVPYAMFSFVWRQAKQARIYIQYNWRDSVIEWSFARAKEVAYKETWKIVDDAYAAYTGRNSSPMTSYVGTLEAERKHRERHMRHWELAGMNPLRFSMKILWTFAHGRRNRDVESMI